MYGTEAGEETKLLGGRRKLMPLSEIEGREDTRRCQIKVQFECALKTKFLESSFQPMTLISSYQSIP